jgi:RNA polymerase-binding transcription factor DksA
MRKVGQASAAPKMKPSQTTGFGKGADVLEEIWRTADRERGKAHLTSCFGVLRKFRAALAAMKADVFGACLCCKATLGLGRMTEKPWTALCTRCQEAADRDDAAILRIRSRG